MKTPRVHDFDPNAKLPELGSPMDRLPAIQKPASKSVPSPITLPTTDQQEKPYRTYGEPSARTNARTPVRDHARTGVYNLSNICFYFLNRSREAHRKGNRY